VPVDGRGAAPVPAVERQPARAILDDDGAVGRDDDGAVGVRRRPDPAIGRLGPMIACAITASWPGSYGNENEDAIREL